MMQKHGSSYREKLLDVLLWKDERISMGQRTNQQLEREVATLTAVVGRRQTERDTLTRLLTANEAPPQSADSLEVGRPEPRVSDLAGLRSGLPPGEGTIRALRRSAVSRITAPLRTLYDVVASRRGTAP